jgi:L-asparaginase
MQVPVVKKIKKSASKIIQVLGMGGTIAGLAPDPQASERYVAAQRSVADLLGELTPHTDLVLQSRQLAQIDSQDLAPGHWQALLQALLEALGDPEVFGVVITHGTDTLEETASFLDEVLPRVAGSVSKPIVLTCAMRPSNAPDADGPQNLADALLLAADDEPRARGIWVVCAGQAHAARWVRKVHPQRLDAFDSAEYPVAAHRLQSPEGCAQWVWSAVPEGGPESKALLGEQGLAPLFSTVPVNWPRVAILTHHAGSEAWEVEAMVAAGVQGLVVASTGNGTVSGLWREALLKAQAQGVVLRFTTRCAQGWPTHVPAGMAEAVLASTAWALTPAKARVRLQLSLLMGWG